MQDGETREKKQVREMWKTGKETVVQLLQVVARKPEAWKY